MPFMGLRSRLIIPLACVLTAYGGFLAYLAASGQRDEILAEAELSTLRLADTVRRSTRHAMLQSHRGDVHQIIEDIGDQDDMDHVRIMNKEGVIVYSSDKSEINRVVDRKAEACYQCHDAKKPLTKLETSERARVFQSTSGHRTLAAIEVIYNEPTCWNADCHAHSEAQNLLGVVDIGVSLEEADQRVTEATHRAILFGLVSTVTICILVGLFIQRFVNRPVQRLLDGTREVAQGNLDCRIRPMRDDEVGHLAQSFNRMTEDLQTAHAELSSWTQKLEEEVLSKTHDLRVAQAQIIQSEKLSSIGLLAAGVAHELNSPLTGILTFAHLVGKKLQDGSPEKEDLGVIISQTERCARIIRQLLDFSRESSPEKKSRDLHVILEQAIALVERQAQFLNIKIERDFAINLPLLSLDASQMQQVFLNLLVNAGEAMPDGGPLTIKTRLSTAADGQPDQVCVVVRDTGVGIPLEDIDKIFDPFFTSKEVGQGTGLGLAVSYGIIERHGGTIGVESTPGEGTAFILILPVDESGNESQ